MCKGSPRRFRIGHNGRGPVPRAGPTGPSALLAAHHGIPRNAPADADPRVRHLRQSSPWQMLLAQTPRKRTQQSSSALQPDKPWGMQHTVPTGIRRFVGCNPQTPAQQVSVSAQVDCSGTHVTGTSQMPSMHAISCPRREQQFLSAVQACPRFRQRHRPRPSLFRTARSQMPVQHSLLRLQVLSVRFVLLHGPDGAGPRASAAIPPARSATPAPSADRIPVRREIAPATDRAIWSNRPTSMNISPRRFAARLDCAAELL
jgi:hypothetical protein